MAIEIETLDELEPLLAAGCLDGAVIGGLDLEGLAEPLSRATVRGTVFLGCRLPRALRGELPDRGAVVFPVLDGFPFLPYRSALYTPEELFEGFDPTDPCTYCDTLDARIYRHWRDTGGNEPTGVLEALARRLHDQAITAELRKLLVRRAAHGGPRRPRGFESKSGAEAGPEAGPEVAPTASTPATGSAAAPGGGRDGGRQAEDEVAARVVAVMGGHSLSRATAAYLEVARLAHRLTRAGYLLVSGGGPGAMEATNLGAWLSPLEPTALEEAVAELAAAPTYRHPDWLATAFRVKGRFLERLGRGRPARRPDDPPERHPVPAGNGAGGISLGIPTWLYGHEPPNPFATHVAKYFANSVREEGLITIARGGIVFAPGNAGTVQEVFQDAAQNRYAVTGEVSPMVFLGRAFWGEEKPVYPLLRQLAQGKQFAALLTVCDSAEEATDFLLAHPPEPATAPPWTFCDAFCGEAEATPTP